MDCYIWYSEEGPGRAAAPLSPLFDVTVHPSSVPTSYYSSDAVILTLYSAKALQRVKPNATQALLQAVYAFHLRL